MHELQHGAPVKNHGVKYGQRPESYRAGAKESALPYLEILIDGNWELYLPNEERQSSSMGDGMHCVTMGHTAAVETRLNLMLYRGEITGRRLEWCVNNGYIVARNGVDPVTYGNVYAMPHAYTFECSERFSAKMGGTTREGAYLDDIADGMRHYGLVAQRDYPTPATFTWDEFHQDIPEPLLSQLLEKGQEFKKWFDIKYEWIDIDRASLIKHMKMAPLAILLPGHEVLNFHTTAQIINYFDSYSPFKKKTKTILYAMKVMVYLKEEEVPDEDLLVDIKYLDSGKQVLKLKNALVNLGWHEAADMPETLDARFAELVLRFQKANLSRTSWAYWFAVMYYRGTLVDKATREYINAALKTYNT